jgi:hypothetical protein
MQVFGRAALEIRIAAEVPEITPAKRDFIF